MNINYLNLIFYENIKIPFILNKKYE